MRDARQVTEFVIMSGPEVHDYLIKIRAQLRAYLDAAFPAFKFSLVSHEAEDMGFLVLPVVGAVGGEDREGFADPDHSTLTEIKMALEAFRPTRHRAN